MNLRAVPVSIKVAFLVLVALAVLGAFLLWQGAFKINTNTNLAPGVTKDVPIPTAFGVVTAKTASSIVINSQFGPRTYAFTEQTKVSEAGKPKNISDVVVGAIVSIAKSTKSIIGEVKAEEIQIIPPPPAAE